jgi:hypothetical protein
MWRSHVALTGWSVRERRRRRTAACCGSRLDMVLAADGRERAATQAAAAATEADSLAATLVDLRRGSAALGGANGALLSGRGSAGGASPLAGRLARVHEPTAGDWGAGLAEACTPARSMAVGGAAGLGTAGLPWGSPSPRRREALATAGAALARARAAEQGLLMSLWVHGPHAARRAASGAARVDSCGGGGGAARGLPWITANGACGWGRRRRAFSIACRASQARRKGCDAEMHESARRCVLLRRGLRCSLPTGRAPWL